MSTFPLSPVGGAEQKEFRINAFKIRSRPYAGGWWRSEAIDSDEQIIAHHDSLYLSEAVTQCRLKAEALNLKYTPK